MNERYFGKVVKLEDDFTVVVNKGSSSGIKEGDKFIVAGIGDIITDPDSGEELERLEIVRGKVIATHVQEKISTMKSCDYDRSSGKREIKKVTSKNMGMTSFFGPQDTVTESIIPGEERLKVLAGVSVGDVLIKAY